MLTQVTEKEVVYDSSRVTLKEKRVPDEDGCCAVIADGNLIAVAKQNAIVATIPKNTMIEGSVTDVGNYTKAQKTVVNDLMKMFISCLQWDPGTFSETTTPIESVDAEL